MRQSQKQDQPPAPPTHAFVPLETIKALADFFDNETHLVRRVTTPLVVGLSNLAVCNLPEVERRLSIAAKMLAAPEPTPVPVPVKVAAPAE